MRKTKLKRARQTINKDIYTDLNRIKNALAGATNTVKGRAGNLLNQQWTDMRDKGIDIQDGVTDYVTDKPIKSISLAVLAGVAIGLFLRK